MTPKKQSWWDKSAMSIKDFWVSIGASFLVIFVIVVVAYIYDNKILHTSQENWEVVASENYSIQYLIENPTTKGRPDRLRCYQGEDDSPLGYPPCNSTIQIPTIEGKDCKIETWYRWNRTSTEIRDECSVNCQGSLQIRECLNYCYGISSFPYNKTTCSACRDYNTKEEVDCP